MILPDVICKVEKSGNRYNAWSSDGTKYTSDISLDCRKNAFNGRYLIGRFPWTQPSGNSGTSWRRITDKVMAALGGEEKVLSGFAGQRRTRKQAPQKRAGGTPRPGVRGVKYTGDKKKIKKLIRTLPGAYAIGMWLWGLNKKEIGPFISLLKKGDTIYSAITATTVEIKRHNKKYVKYRGEILVGALQDRFLIVSDRGKNKLTYRYRELKSISAPPPDDPSLFLTIEKKTGEEKICFTSHITTYTPEAVEHFSKWFPPFFEKLCPGGVTDAVAYLKAKKAEEKARKLPDIVCRVEKSGNAFRAWSTDGYDHTPDINSSSRRKALEGNYLLGRFKSSARRQSWRRITATVLKNLGGKRNIVFEDHKEKPKKLTNKEKGVKDPYNHFLFYFYNKAYPANFLQAHLAIAQGTTDFFDGVSLPSPQKWSSLQNSCTRGRNPPRSFNVNERLFFILLHGFVASLQSSIELKRENPFTGFFMTQHGFSQKAAEPGKEFFEKHSQDITKISGTSFSYEEYAKVVECYANVYHSKVDKAIRGDSTVLMDDLEFDFRIGMKAGILNTEVIIESLSISGFGNQLESFFPVLKKKLRSFSVGGINCYCNDLLYRYSKIAKLKKGTEKTTVISAFRKDRKKIYDNIYTTITLLPDAMETFIEKYKELKNKTKKFTERKKKTSAKKKAPAKKKTSAKKKAPAKSTTSTSRKTKLKEAKDFFDEGLIDEEEYKQMKKEILGK